MSVAKYQSLVEALQKRFGFNEKAKESFLDILYGKKTGEKFDEFFYNVPGQGKVYQGSFIAEKKDGKIDLSYALQSVDFVFEEIESEDWVVTWRFIFPTGWKYKKKPRTINTSQKIRFDEWFKSEFNKHAIEEIKKIEK